MLHIIMIKFLNKTKMMPSANFVLRLLQQEKETKLKNGRSFITDSGFA